MVDPRPLRLVTLLGSLRAKSYNAAMARALPGLAPAGITVEALGSVGAFPIYDSDLQERGFPEAVTAMGRAIEAADGLVFVTPEHSPVPPRPAEGAFWQRQERVEGDPTACGLNTAVADARSIALCLRNLSVQLSPPYPHWRQPRTSVRPQEALCEVRCAVAELRCLSSVI